MAIRRKVTYETSVEDGQNIQTVFKCNFRNANSNAWRGCYEEGFSFDGIEGSKDDGKMRNTTDSLGVLNFLATKQMAK